MRKRLGFTLIELLTAISIINFIATIVLVNLSGTRDRARIARAKQFEGQFVRSQQLDLIGEWTFSSTAGLTVNDSSGFGNPLTIAAGGSIGSADCITPPCASMPAAQLITGTITGASFPSNGFAVTAWVKLTDYSATWELFTLGTPDLIFQVLTAGPTGATLGRIDFVPDDGVFVDIQCAGPPAPALRLNTWHHVVLIYDGVVGRLLIDGKLVVGEHVAQSVALDPDPPARIYLKGLVDDIRLYSRGPVVGRTDSGAGWCFVQ